jgi:phosphatidylserine decarboxylase
MDFFPFTFRLHKEGSVYVPVVLITAAVLCALSFAYLPAFFSGFIFGVSLVLAWLVLNFFRYPVRTAPTQPGLVIAPCDGKVVVIEEVYEPLYFKDKVLQVSIFMSPLNVHVNWNPISGVVKFFKYLPGKYLVAWHPKSSTENEQTFAVVASDAKPGVLVGYKQIAGALARRIKWYIAEGQAVQQGGEFGFIKFGSRVDVLLPMGTRLNVKLGQVTRGGETVLGTL